MTRVALAPLAPGALVPEGAEVALLGLGTSGAPAARLLAGLGHRLYASDAGSGDAVRALADELAADRVAVQTGGHDPERIARAALVVASPGIPPTAPPIAAAAAAGVPIVNEVELGLRALDGLRYVAITGTNGKTTSTALAGHLLRAVGRTAAEGGNIGTPLTQYVLAGTAPEWLALELSSFQLRHLPSLRPDVGVVTNLAPDHLDWYPSLDAYYADKALMLRNDAPERRWVLNGDDAEVLALHRRLPAAHASHGGLAGRVARFSLRDPSAQAYFDEEWDALVLLHEPLLPRAAFPLLGPHNVANALAAALAVALADPAHRSAETRARLAEGLRTAGALPHRMEPVAEVDGVLWINDSKATNVASTRVALEGMRRPYVLLLGGRHKGEPYTTLAEPFARMGRTVLAFGEAGERIVADLGGRVPVERVAGGFAEVMARARALARPGDAVLLSPACSSYDMFRNYEERGASFRRLAQEPA